MGSRSTALVALLWAALPAAQAALSVQGRFPQQGAAEVCPDAPLRLVFDGPVTLGTTGRIVIADSTGTVADTIDLAGLSQAMVGANGPGANAPIRVVGGFPLHYHPVVAEGNTVTIRPRAVLAYGRAYTVAIEPGAIVDAAGTGWHEPAAVWSFATRSAPPSASATTLTVAADGTGDFCTVQGAIDFVPAGHPGRITILVRRGFYGELVDIPQGKDRITLRGEDRHESVIACANNAVVNPQHRTMMGVQADDIVIQNLTLHNLTPKGGKQSETLQVRGARCILVDDDFFSFQDTLRLDGGVYVKDCLIAGDVDFIWGAGTVFFDKCTLDAVHNGWLVQSRNNAQRLGYVFADCTINTAPDATHVLLARIDPRIYPSSNVAFIRCRMGPGIRPEGWELDRGTDRSRQGAVATPPAQPGARAEASAAVDNTQPATRVRFWEYQSADLSGKPLDVSGRLPFSRQLAASELPPLADPAVVLGAWVAQAP